jgi:hypothetical protein
LVNLLLHLQLAQYVFAQQEVLQPELELVLDQALQLETEHKHLE